MGIMGGMGIMRKQKKIIYLPTNNPFTLKFNTMKNLMQMYTHFYSLQ